jgi:hypothetical protein
VLSSCSSAATTISAGGSESMQAVLDYVDAAEEGDCEALIDLVTEESVQMIGDGGRSDAIAACEDALSAPRSSGGSSLDRSPARSTAAESGGS